MDEHRPRPRFGALLREYRSRCGLTQQQLADLSTVSIRAVRNLESGQATRPRRQTVRLLVDALRIGEPQRISLELAASRQARPPRLPTGPLGVGDDAAFLPPPPANGLVGREVELRALREHIVANERLVAVVGLAGVGKTRLAYELASRLSADDGFAVLWLPLPAHAADSELPALASELLADATADPTPLSRLIGKRRTLLVVDGDRGAIPGDRIVRLLQQCRHVRVLVTTRDPARAPEAAVFPLAPLPVPSDDRTYDAAGLAQVDSARLLVQDMRHMRPEFRLDEANVDVVARLCWRLDGLPAALALAASWSLVYSPDELLAELSANPLTMVLEPIGAPAPFDATESLRQVLASLAPTTSALLATVAALPGYWSVEQAAERAGGTRGEVAREVHSYLLRGLIRRGANGNGSCFQVLNLVRQVLGA